MVRYPVLMNWKACCLMALASWMGGVADSVIDVGMVFSFPYCDSLQVDHFFCEVPAVLRLSCADTSLFEDFIYACCVIMLLLPLGVVVASYAKKKKKKASSTLQNEDVHCCPEARKLTIGSTT